MGAFVGGGGLLAGRWAKWALARAKLKLLVARRCFFWARSGVAGARFWLSCGLSLLLWAVASSSLVGVARVSTVKLALLSSDPFVRTSTVPLCLYVSAL